MVAQVEVAGIEVTVVQDNQYGILALEFSEIFSPSVVVEAKYIPIKPDFTSSESRTASLFQGDLMHREPGEDNASCLSSFDTYFAKVLFKDNTADTRVRFQCHLDDFGLPVRIGAEISDA